MVAETDLMASRRYTEGQQSLRDCLGLSLFSVTVHAEDSVSPDGWKYATEGSGTDAYAVIKDYSGTPPR